MVSMGSPVNDNKKSLIYAAVDRGLTNTQIADETQIPRRTVVDIAKPYREKRHIPLPQTQSQPDIAEIVARVMREMSGNPHAPPDKIEVVQAPAQQIWLPSKSKVVDLSGKKFERTVFISDFHHPFQDDAAIKVALSAIRDYRPQSVLIAGDYYDCYSISDHDKDPGRCDTIQDEFDAAKPTSEAINEATGDALKIFKKGNHEERIDRMQRKNPGLFKLRSLELPIAAELPKDWLYYQDQTRFKIGALTALHGNLKGRGNSVKHAAYGMLSKLRTSCIFGHFHRFQTFYERTADGTYRAGWANGHMCDVDQAEYITSPDWQGGFSTIDYDWSLGVFSVTPHLIVRNILRWGNKTYQAASAVMQRKTA
jgi:predicted phosphodiesterase